MPDFSPSTAIKFLSSPVPVCMQILAGSIFLENVYLYKPRMSLAALRALNFDAVIDFDDVRNL